MTKILKCPTKFGKARIENLWKATKLNQSLLLFVLLFNSYLFYGSSIDESNKVELKTNSFLAQMQISGKITDSEGLPLPGVNILVKGTNKGALSDFDGAYSIMASEGDVLVFSYVGMKTQEITVSTSSNIDVNMAEDTAVLEEVVVIGYGTVKKKNIVGSMATVDQEDLITNPGGDVISAIQGQAAGVQIISESGAPGAGFEVVVRGASSISGGSTPLYVIDGVQVEADGSNGVISDTNGGDQLSQIGALSFLNPSDIESINVLKDASATAIYGSRGANGVVIITTKSGNYNQKSLSVNYSSTLSMLPKPYDLLDMEEYIEMRSFRTPDNSRFTNQDTGETRVFPSDSLIFTNHEDAVFRPSLTQQVTVSFSNGNDTSTTAGSVSYLSNDGIIKNTDFNRINSRLRYSINASDKLSFDTNINGSFSTANGVSFNGNGQPATSGVIGSMVNSVPGVILSPLTAADIASGETDDDQFNNVQDLLSESVNNTSFVNILGSLGMNYKITDNLTYRSQIAGRLTYSESNLFYPRTIVQGVQQNGEVTLRSNLGQRMDFQNTLDYKIPLKGVDISLLGGVESRIIQNTTRQTTSYDFLIADNGPYSIQTGTFYQQPFSGKDKSQGLSYFSRAQFDILDKYLITGTFRADGSSKFGPDNKYGYFYSIGGAWKINNYNFLKNSRAVNNLTLRGSYGTSGNDRIPNGRVFTNYAIGIYPDAGNGNQLALTIDNLGDPSLKWETTKQINVGIDAAFFRNRFRFTVDAYRKETTDLLFLVDRPAYAGVGKQITNIGQLDNEGLEVSVTGMIIRKPNMRWRLRVNASNNISTIVDLGDINETRTETASGGGFFPNMGLLRVGEALGTFFGFEYDGVYDFADFEEFDAYPTREAAAERYRELEELGVTYTVKTVDNPVSPRPGYVKFKDQNGDGIIDDNDRTIIGNGNPDIIGGISNRFTFGKLNIDINFNYALGGDLYNAAKVFKIGLRANGSNMTRDYYYNMWRPERADYTEPGVRDNRNNGLSQESSYYIEDASFLRLKRVNISYSLAEYVKKFKLDDLILNISGNDLVTITGYSGNDPEVRSSRIQSRGIDRGTYPRTPTITMGATINF